MIRRSGDGCRLTAHLAPGGPCLAVAEHQPDRRWLVNGRAMSREHAGIALEAVVTVAAASPPPHGTAQVPAGGPSTKAHAESGGMTPEIIRQLTPSGLLLPRGHAARLAQRAADHRG